MSNRRRWATTIVGVSALVLVLVSLSALYKAPTFAAAPVGVAIVPATATVAPAGSVSVNVVATTPTGTDLGAWKADIVYDNTVLTATACTAGAGTGGLCNKALAANTVRANGASTGGLTGTVMLATITFSAIGANGTSSALAVTIVTFADVNGTPIASPTATNGQINVVGNRVKFTSQPGGGTAGQVWAAQPVVTVQDTNGATITTGADSTASITIHIETGPAGATLTCTNNTVTAAAGVASFAGCKIDKSGSYTLMAMATGLASDTSASFNITAGPATKLGFTTQPGGGTGGVVWAQQPVVAVQDTLGNTVTSATNSVVLSITTGTGTAGATLTCTNNTLASTAGVANFSSCKIDKAGAGYTLTAKAAGLTDGVSSVFNITVGTAAMLAFTNQPGGGAAGQAWAQQPVVAVQDAGGNTVTTATNSITLSITTGTGAAGAALTCTTNPMAAASGVATFAGCKIDKSATGYTLTASATGLASGTSATFNIAAGPAAMLGFVTQPGGGTGGVAWAQQPAVAVQDSLGNTVTSDNATGVTLGITTGTGTAGATLTCATNTTVQLTVANGVAVFAGCKIDKAGAGYTLTAKATGLADGVSAAFNITVGPPAMLGFTTQPGGGTAGQAWSQQPVVAIQDAGGNTVTTAVIPATLAISTGPAGAVLICTSNTVNAVAGLATFVDCKIEKAGTYTLSATSTGLTSGASASFNITAGAGVKLGFIQQPSGSSEGVVWPTQPVVAIQDSLGNTVSAAPATQVSIFHTGGDPAAALTCDQTSNQLTTTNGVAAFTGCKINLKGDGYTLTATATGLTSATSAPFNVTSIVLVFTTEPKKGAHTFAFGIQPVVKVQLAGVTQTGDNTTQVTLRIKAGAGTPGARVICATNPVTVVAGVATFSGCKIDLPGAGYMLEATGQAVGPGVTQPFLVTWAGDANGDCKVNIVDFSVLATSFLKKLADVGFDPGADINGDDTVDIQDFSILKTMFGTRCTQLMVAPTSGLAGATVTVTGTSYIANVDVTISLDGTVMTTTPAVVAANGDGNFSATIVAPAGTPTGPHVVRAGQRSERVVAAAIFNVTVQ